MRINGEGNLVLPLRVDEDGNPSIYAYSTPVSREIFEANYRIISATYAEIFEKGIRYATMAGARVAALALRDHGKREVDRLAADGEEALNPADTVIAEIKRLTVILAPGEDGWESLPVDIAIKRNRITMDDWSDLVGSLVFFTCASAMAKREIKRAIMEVTASTMGASLVPLNSTEFAASLRKSSVEKNTAAIA